MSLAVELGLAVTAAAVASGGSYVLNQVQDRLIERSVSALRRRLRAEVLGELEPVESKLLTTSRDDEEASGPTSASSKDSGRNDSRGGRAVVQGDRVESETLPTDQRFAALLIEYYAYGLTQARRSFSVSLTCSILGGLVLISGVGMAIFKAGTTGDQYASVTASVAGLVMTVIGTLFHRRADLALKHMESQTQSLRQDMKVERDAGQAIRLLEDVNDSVLKAHLQAALILKFSAAKLPELGGVLKPADPLPQVSVNGTVPQQQSDSPAS